MALWGSNRTLTSAPKVALIPWIGLGPRNVPKRFKTFETFCLLEKRFRRGLACHVVGLGFLKMDLRPSMMDTDDGVLAKSWLGLLNGDLVRQTFQNVSKLQWALFLISSLTI